MKTVFTVISRVCLCMLVRECIYHRNKIKKKCHEKYLISYLVHGGQGLGNLIKNRLRTTAVAAAVRAESLRRKLLRSNERREKTR